MPALPLVPAALGSEPTAEEQEAFSQAMALYRTSMAQYKLALAAYDQQKQRNDALLADHETALNNYARDLAEYNALRSEAYRHRFTVPEGHLLIAGNHPIDSAYADGVFTEPTPSGPNRDAMVITARQFFIALANSGYVTGDEAIAAAQTGAVPASIAAVFAGLPTQQAVAAQITWAKMTTVSRTDPLIGAVAAAMSLTDQTIDQFFITAASI